MILFIRLSVTKFIVPKQYTAAEVSEQVNRKCPLRNTILQLSTLYTSPIPQLKFPTLKIKKFYLFVIILLFDQ